MGLSSSKMARSSSTPVTPQLNRRFSWLRKSRTSVSEDKSATLPRPAVRTKTPAGFRTNPRDGERENHPSRQKTSEAAAAEENNDVFKIYNKKISEAHAASPSAVLQDFGDGKQRISTSVVRHGIAEVFTQKGVLGEQIEQTVLCIAKTEASGGHASVKPPQLIQIQMKPEDAAGLHELQVANQSWLAQHRAISLKTAPARENHLQLPNYDIVMHEHKEPVTLGEARMGVATVNVEDGIEVVHAKESNFGLRVQSLSFCLARVEVSSGRATAKPMCLVNMLETEMSKRPRCPPVEEPSVNPAGEISVLNLATPPPLISDEGSRDSLLIHFTETSNTLHTEPPVEADAAPRSDESSHFLVESNLSRGMEEDHPLSPDEVQNVLNPVQQPQVAECSQIPIEHPEIVCANPPDDYVVDGQTKDEALFVISPQEVGVVLAVPQCADSFEQKQDKGCQLPKAGSSPQSDEIPSFLLESKILGMASVNVLGGRETINTTQVVYGFSVDPISTYAGLLVTSACTDPSSSHSILPGVPQTPTALVVSQESASHAGGHSSAEKNGGLPWEAHQAILRVFNCDLKEPVSSKTPISSVNVCGGKVESCRMEEEIGSPVYKDSFCIGKISVSCSTGATAMPVERIVIVDDESNTEDDKYVPWVESEPIVRVFNCDPQKTVSVTTPVASVNVIGGKEGFWILEESLGSSILNDSFCVGKINVSVSMGATVKPVEYIKTSATPPQTDITECDISYYAARYTDKSQLIASSQATVHLPSVATELETLVAYEMVAEETPIVHPEPSATKEEEATTPQSGKSSSPLMELGVVESKTFGTAMVNVLQGRETIQVVQMVHGVAVDKMAAYGGVRITPASVTLLQMH